MLRTALRGDDLNKDLVEHDPALRGYTGRVLGVERSERLVAAAVRAWRGGRALAVRLGLGLGLNLALALLETTLAQYAGGFGLGAGGGDGDAWGEVAG